MVGALDLFAVGTSITLSRFLGTMETISDPPAPSSLSAKSEAAPTKPFPFMQLPLEIRIMVYKEFLVMPSPIFFGLGLKTQAILRSRNPDTSIKENGIPQTLVCQLFLTSRSIYQEAMPLYFSLNRFHFSNLHVLLVVLSSLKPNCRRQIARISFAYQGPSPAKAFKVLSTCVGLRDLIIRLTGFTPNLIRLEDELPRRLMKMGGISQLLKIRGIKKLGVSFTGLEQCGCSWVVVDKKRFLKATKVLKEPQSPLKLKRQESKDYPREKAKRTVFGKANVMTRTEKKLAEEQKKLESK